MIENPKNLTEQLLNLSERIGIEMRALLNTIGTKVSKDDLGKFASLDSLSEAPVLETDPTELFNSTLTGTASVSTTSLEEEDDSGIGIPSVGI